MMSIERTTLAHQLGAIADRVLSPQQREALRYHTEGYEIAEIAWFLQTNHRNAQRLLDSAKTRLRREIGRAA